MRRYVIEVSGDNDALHERALKAAVVVIENHNTLVESAVVEAPPPAGFVPVGNCIKKVR